MIKCNHELKVCKVTGFTYCKKCNTWHTMIELGKTPASFKENWKEAYLKV